MLISGVIAFQMVLLLLGRLLTLGGSKGTVPPKRLEA